MQVTIPVPWRVWDTAWKSPFCLVSIGRFGASNCSFFQPAMQGKCGGTSWLVGNWPWVMMTCRPWEIQSCSVSFCFQHVTTAATGKATVFLQPQQEQEAPPPAPPEEKEDPNNQTLLTAWIFFVFLCWKRVCFWAGENQADERDVYEFFSKNAGKASKFYHQICGLRESWWDEISNGGWTNPWETTKPLAIPSVVPMGTHVSFIFLGVMTRLWPIIYWGPKKLARFMGFGIQRYGIFTD